MTQQAFAADATCVADARASAAARRCDLRQALQDSRSLPTEAAATDAVYCRRRRPRSVGRSSALDVARNSNWHGAERAGRHCRLWSQATLPGLGERAPGLVAQARACPTDRGLGGLGSTGTSMRLRGGSRGEASELVFASVPKEEWDKGPAAGERLDTRRICRAARRTAPRESGAGDPGPSVVRSVGSSGSRAVRSRSRWAARAALRAAPLLRRARAPGDARCAPEARQFAGLVGRGASRGPLSARVAVRPPARLR